MATEIPKEPLRALIATLSDLDPADVLWDGEAVPFPAPVNGEIQGRIVLNPIQRTAEGWDERRREYNEDGTTTITSVGQRFITISIKAEMFGKQEGFDILEKVRTRMSRETSCMKLREAACSLASVEDIRSIPGFSDNRAIYIATMDLQLNQCVTDPEGLEEGALGAGYIDGVEITGEEDLELAGTDEIDATE